MAGPFVDDHAAALAAVRRVKDAACKLDVRAGFMSWGTCRQASYDKPGRLNVVAGLPQDGASADAIRAALGAADLGGLAAF